MAAKGQEKDDRHWFVRHQHTIRDWLVLLAAVVAGIVGFVQISDERDARKSAEADTERVERRAQANEISAWLTSSPPGAPDGEAVMLSNRSNQPVYQAVVSRVTIQANGAYTGRQIPKSISHQEQQSISVLPPGEYRLQFGLGFGGMSKSPGFEIAFRDQEGRNWVRYANGVLKEINQSPIFFYDLIRPVNWQMPEETE